LPFNPEMPAGGCFPLETLPLWIQPHWNLLPRGGKDEFAIRQLTWLKVETAHRQNPTAGASL
jgi:hypothetical protein